jgi:hypothetical protein
MIAIGNSASFIALLNMLKHYRFEVSFHLQLLDFHFNQFPHNCHTLGWSCFYRLLEMSEKLI